MKLPEKQFQDYLLQIRALAEGPFDEMQKEIEVINKFPAEFYGLAIKMKIAEMSTWIHALRTMVYDFGKDYDNDPHGEYIEEKAAMCKPFSIETVKMVSDEMLEIFGGVKPMEHVKVVELSTYLTAPTAARVLAEWGAVFNMPYSDEENLAFDVANFNKRFVTLNLKSETGLEVAYKLLAEAFEKMTRSETMSLFKGADLPCESANEPLNIYEDEQCWANDILCRYPYPQGGRNFATNPVRFSSLGTPDYFSGGKQGSATEEVMAALGYTREQVDAAIAQGAVEGSKNLKRL